MVKITLEQTPNGVWLRRGIQGFFITKTEVERIPGLKDFIKEIENLNL